MKPTWTALLAALALWAPAHAQAPGHGFHPPMPGQQYYVYCTLASHNPPINAEVPLQLPVLTSPADLRQTITVHPKVPPLRVTRYLPQAVLTQQVEPATGPGGSPALEMAISGPTQSFRRWLVAGDRERNRLISLVGTWRYQVVQNDQQRKELLGQFREELSRAPTLRISRRDGGSSRTIPAIGGQTQRLEELGCTVRIREFYPHFGIDDRTKKPTNRSTERLNPAALVQIEHAGKTTEQWIFSKFPDFKMDPSKTTPYRLTLDCPLPKKGNAPDFMIITTPKGPIESWVRHRGKVSTKAIKLGEKVRVNDSQYQFELVQQVPAGTLVERYETTALPGGMPALRFELVKSGGGIDTHWLGIGKTQIVSTPLGPMTVAFGQRQPKPPPPGAHQ